MASHGSTSIVTWIVGWVAFQVLISASYEGLSGPVKPVNMLSLTTGPEAAAVVAAAEVAAAADDAPAAEVAAAPADVAAAAAEVAAAAADVAVPEAVEEPPPQAVRANPHATAAARDIRVVLDLRMTFLPGVKGNC
ncbi:hypothetical protein acdb102_04660 [Acidothermaceae bacterium B102]|nr:hypothetical protein acdb102_04660 [Acidothermaceae bacterium B102]